MKRVWYSVYKNLFNSTQHIPARDTLQFESPPLRQFLYWSKHLEYRRLEKFFKLLFVMDFSLQQDPGWLPGWTHISGCWTVGHSLLVQYSQWPPPETCTPFSSTSVEHQGLGSPSMVVQAVCSTPYEKKQIYFTKTSLLNGCSTNM